MLAEHFLQLYTNASFEISSIRHFRQQKSPQVGRTGSLTLSSHIVLQNCYKETVMRGT